MGLDGVELLMAIEDEFQIVITEDEAYHIQTPDDLTTLVFSKLRDGGSPHCSSQHSFYLVRQKIADKFGVQRNAVKPNTKLVELVDRKTRKRFLKNITRELSSSNGVYLGFEQPEYIKNIRLVSSIIIFPILLYVLNYQIGYAVFVLFLYLWLFSLITEPLKNELPKNFQTVADLVKINASLDSSVWSRHDVYERVKEIIVEQLSVDPKMVLPNSHLVDDLGMD
jgi:acyl carrier protein